MTVWDDGNVRVTIFQIHNAVVLTSGATITSIAFGDSGTVNGHRVEVPPAGGMIIVDGSRVIVLGETSLLDPSSSQLSRLAGEKEITAHKLHHNRVLLISGSETITVAAGSQADRRRYVCGSRGRIRRGCHTHVFSTVVGLQGKRRTGAEQLILGLVKRPLHAGLAWTEHCDSWRQLGHGY